MIVAVVHPDESVTYLAGGPDAPFRGFGGAENLRFSGTLETRPQPLIRAAAVTHATPQNCQETVTFQTTRPFLTRSAAEAYAATWQPPAPGCVAFQTLDGEDGMLMPGAIVQAPEMDIRGSSLIFRYTITGPPPRQPGGTLPALPEIVRRVITEDGPNGEEKWWEVGFVWPRLLSGYALAGWTDTTAGATLAMQWSEDLVSWFPGIYTDAAGSPEAVVGGYQYWTRSIFPIDSAIKQATLIAEQINGDPRNNPFTALILAGAPQMLPNFPYTMPGDAALMQADIRAAGWIGATVTASSDVDWRIEIRGVEYASLDVSSRVEWPVYYEYNFFGTMYSIWRHEFAGQFLNSAGVRTALSPQFARLAIRPRT